MDIEKAFDSLDHSFLISVLKKFGFGKNFITWMEVLLNNIHVSEMVEQLSNILN